MLATQLTTVPLVHEVLRQLVDPILTEGVKSVAPKLNPAKVWTAPPEVGPFIGAVDVRVGASYEKTETAVPI
jgi:hypothetical protein